MRFHFTREAREMLEAILALLPELQRSPITEDLEVLQDCLAPNMEADGILTGRYLVLRVRLIDGVCVVERIRVNPAFYGAD